METAKAAPNLSKTGFISLLSLTIVYTINQNSTSTGQLVNRHVNREKDHGCLLHPPPPSTWPEKLILVSLIFTLTDKNTIKMGRKNEGAKPMHTINLDSNERKTTKHTRSNV